MTCGSSVDEADWISVGYVVVLVDAEDDGCVPTKIVDRDVQSS